MGEACFLTASTMERVVRMTATDAFGITFVFLVDTANFLLFHNKANQKWLRLVQLSPKWQRQQEMIFLLVYWRHLETMRSLHG